MRFSKRKYPFLHYMLGDGKINDFRVHLDIKDNSEDNCITLLKAFKKFNLFVDKSAITRPFFNAITESQLKIFDERFCSEYIFKEQQHLFLLPYGACQLFAITKSGTFNECDYYTALMQGNHVHDYVFRENSEIHAFGLSWEEYGKSKNFDRLRVVPHFGLSFIAFCEFGPKDQKVIEPKKKLKAFNCVYKNDSTANIKIYDITHYTDLIIKGGTWQPHLWWCPCGEGKSKRELRWRKGHKRDVTVRKSRRTKMEEELK